MNRPDPLAPGPPGSRADNGEFSRSFTEAGVCVARLDARGRVIEANDDFIRLFGGSPADICGRGFYDLFGAGTSRKKLRKGIIVLMVSDRLGDENSLIPGSKKILSEMDSRILEGVAAGLPSGRLAALLHISRGGVEYHVTSLLRKLKVANRTAMVSKAYANGMLAIGEWPPRVARDFVK